MCNTHGPYVATLLKQIASKEVSYNHAHKQLTQHGMSPTKATELLNPGLLQDPLPVLPTLDLVSISQGELQSFTQLRLRAISKRSRLPESSEAWKVLNEVIEGES